MSRHKPSRTNRLMHRDAEQDRHTVLRESFSSLEHAPVGIVVVHGGAHTVLYANDSFRQASGLDDAAIVGRPVAEVLENPASEVSHKVPSAVLVALLDRVRGERAQNGGVNVSKNISVNISTNVSVEVGANFEAGTGNHGAWRCMVWPVELRGVGIDQLVIELWHAREGESSLIRQREIAERMLVSALRERALAEENAQLYEVANAARLVAEEAKSRAEEAQHEAEAANSAKAQFLANMSHELRTPLNAISGYAQLIELGLRGPVTEAQVHDLQRIQRSQSHLLGLINAVLSYAKLEAGRVVYAIQNVTIQDVVVEAQSLISPQLRMKGLIYHYVPCVDLVEESRRIPVLVKADAEKVRQILLNLLTNAVKFTDAGGQINVACRTVDGTASVSVTDTGRGIPADKVQSIFQPFVQIGRSLTSGDTGVGLGLAISRDLAVGMAGDLTVKSVEGQGSTFTLTLPLTA